MLRQANRNLLLVLASATLLLAGARSRAGAGIIDSLLQVRNRYTNHQPLAGEPMNASASALVEQFAASALGPEPADYQSPINRIMELIGHKPPPPAPEVSGSAAQQQHWALLGPEGQQQVIRMAERQEQRRLLLQHQPAASAGTTFDSIPEEPQIYQLAPGIENLNDNQQVTLVPYQRTAQPAPSAEPTQPIFLTAYVPEAARLAPPAAVAEPQRAPAREPAVVRVAGQVALPDSIQQANATWAEESGEEEPEGGEHQSSQNQQQEAPQQPAGEDESEADEEPQPKTQSDEGDGEEPPTATGSSSYRQKYDSDTMDEPARDANHHGRLSEAESNHQPKVGGGLLSVGLNDDCLQCICRASSGCDYHLGCITRGAHEKHCGPFQLTEEYWRLAGKPGDQANNFESFEDCANDADCAVETVTNYMKKHHRDCDGDDNITCLDYARLHRLKPHECSKLQNLENRFDYYWAKFQRCAETYNRSRTGDDEDI